MRLARPTWARSAAHVRLCRGAPFLLIGAALHFFTWRGALTDAWTFAGERRTVPTPRVSIVLLLADSTTARRVLQCACFFFFFLQQMQLFPLHAVVAVFS